jgi:hypothetical protein
VTTESARQATLLVPTLESVQLSEDHARALYALGSAFFAYIAPSPLWQEQIEAVNALAKHFALPEIECET